VTFIVLCLVGLWAVVFADDAISDVRLRLARRAAARAYDRRAK
jgi:hypothetical protein